MAGYILRRPYDLVEGWLEPDTPHPMLPNVGVETNLRNRNRV